MERFYLFFWFDCTVKRMLRLQRQTCLMFFGLVLWFRLTDILLRLSKVFFFRVFLWFDCAFIFGRNYYYFHGWLLRWKKLLWWWFFWRWRFLCWGFILEVWLKGEFPTSLNVLTLVSRETGMVVWFDALEQTLVKIFYNWPLFIRRNNRFWFVGIGGEHTVLHLLFYHQLGSFLFSMFGKEHVLV
jgi:hypothetical protein